MTKHDAFMRAIVEAPDDDNPRLQFADWLEENGNGAHAEFIYVQCELARWPCECDSEERVYHEKECLCNEKFSLQRREWELLDTYRLTWLPRPLMDLESQYARDVCVYRRGFVESLSCTAADFLTHADVLTAATPLRQVTLTTWPEAWATRHGPFEHESDDGITYGFGPVRNGGLFAVAVLPGHGDVMLRLLNARWNKIKFTLPSERGNILDLPASQSGQR